MWKGQMFDELSCDAMMADALLDLHLSIIVFIHMLSLLPISPHVLISDIFNTSFSKLSWSTEIYYNRSL